MKKKKKIIPIEEVEADPNLTRLDSGAVYGKKEGHIVAHTNTGGVQFTAGTDGTGRKAALARWENQRNAFAEGLAEGLLSGTADPKAGKAEAWKVAGKKVGELLAKSTNSRGVAELLKAAGEMSGFTPNKLDAELVVAEHKTQNRDERLHAAVQALIEQFPIQADGRVIDVETDEG